jgi:AraC-like DNA-binding protein
MNTHFEIRLPENKAIDRQQDAASSCLIQFNDRRRDFLTGLPVEESESVQLGPGTQKYLSRRMCGRDLVILSYEVAPKLIVHTVPKRDWVVLVMSLNRQSDFVFKGRKAQPFDLFLSAGYDGYMTTGKDRRNVAIAIRRTRLISACAALVGVGIEDIRLGDFVLPWEQGLGQCLHHELIGVAGQSHEHSSPSELQFEMPEALENDIICMLAAQIVPAMYQVPEVNYFRKDALRVVRAATGASKALPVASLADLCEAAGVSQRWLNKCFLDVLGVPPYRYIRLARLSRARDLLLASEAKPSLVKCVALSFGYYLSGRFAAEYRSVFGENPTDTLRRSGAV